MNKQFLVILFALNSIFSLGQSNDEKINRLVDLVCDCASKAKDEFQFELCEKIVKPADSLAAGDKLYFLKRLITQCDKAFEKYWGPRRDSLKIQPCLFLQQEDIKDFNLQKSMVDNISINWSGQTQGQLLKELYDERRKFTSESLAIEYIDKQRELTESEGIKPTTFSIETFQTAEAFNFGNVGNYYLYHVYVRKHKLVCFLTVSLTKDDIITIKDLLERLSIRLKNCK